MKEPSGASPACRIADSRSACGWAGPGAGRSVPGPADADRLDRRVPLGHPVPLDRPVPLGRLDRMGHRAGPGHRVQTGRLARHHPVPGHQARSRRSHWIHRVRWERSADRSDQAGTHSGCRAGGCQAGSRPRPRRPDRDHHSSAVRHRMRLRRPRNWQPADPRAADQGCSGGRGRLSRPVCRVRCYPSQERGHGRRGQRLRADQARPAPRAADGRCLARPWVPDRPGWRSSGRQLARLPPGCRAAPDRRETAAWMRPLPRPRPGPARRWSARCADRPERRNRDRRREGRRRHAPGGDGRREGPQVFRDDQPYVAASTPPRHVVRAAQTSAGCRLRGRTTRSSGSSRSSGRPRPHRPGTPRVRVPSARARGWP